MRTRGKRKSKSEQRKRRDFKRQKNGHKDKAEQR